MIVLDTNQLDRHSLDSPFMALARVLAQSTGHELAISRVTYDEHCAHYDHRLRRAYSQEAKLRRELEELLRISRVDEKHEKRGMRLVIPGNLYEQAVDEASSAYNSRLADEFRVIDLDGASAAEALRREAWRIAPASTSFDTKGTGARDAAIWLSLIKESARFNERIYFISSDKRAFQTEQCAADVEASAASIVVLIDFGELIAALADGVEAEVDLEQVRESAVLRGRFRQYVNDTDIIWEIGRIAIERPAESSMWTSRDLNLEFMHISDVRGFVIGGSKWITGRVRWSINYIIEIKQYSTGNIGVYTSIQIWNVSFQIVSSLLLKAVLAVEEVEILGIGRPSHIVSKLEELRKLN